MRRSIVLSTYLAGSALALWFSAGSSHAGEVPVPKKLREHFQTLDRDGDKGLSQAEFPYGKQAFVRGDSDKNGRLSLREVFYLHAGEETRKLLSKGTPKLLKKFKAGDKDGNGVLSRKEFPAPEMLFKKFDRDGNGEVSWSEALAYSVEEEVGKVFAKHDQDLSGDLTLDEVKQDEPHKLLVFVAADANRDGKLTGKELYALIYAARVKQGPQSGAKAKPGQTKPAPKGKQGLADKIRKGFSALMKRDSDKSGALSRAEFPGSGTLFSRIDLDRDGQVDPSELQQRARIALALIARGERIKGKAVKELKTPLKLDLLGAEIKGLFEAGRYEEARRLMDEVELRLARALSK